MSRSRKIKLSRSKAIVLATAGVLSVATAASATAATQTPQTPQGIQGIQGTQGTAEHTAEHSAGRVSSPGTDQTAVGALKLVVTASLARPMADVADQQGSAAIFLEHAHQVRLVQARVAIAQRQAASKRAAELAAKKAAATAAAQSPAAAQTAAVTVPAAAGSPRQIAAAMLGSFGWSASQFSCLEPLWAHESGWSVSAYNAGSGAFGIPQALPGSRMASAGPDWQTDAATQIKWGLQYIKGTYGSPCGAWAHEEATGWY